MTLKVGVYASHDKALQAIQALGRANFPLNKVSLVGKAEIIDDNVQIKSFDNFKNSPVIAGAIMGPVLGLLTGLGLFAIPGFGFLFGAGALIGTIAGFDMGLVGGGILTLLATMGIKKDATVKYEQHLNEGKFLVIAQGSLDEIERAEHILHTEGVHLELDSH